jgi:uncharacterized protein
MEYEWDENKNEINILKHGVSFEAVARAFNTPYIEWPSDRNAESRWTRLIEIHGIVIAVVYTLRGDKIPHYFSKKGTTK